MRPVALEGGAAREGMFLPPPGMSGGPRLAGLSGANLGWKLPLGVHLSIPACPHCPVPAPGTVGSQVPSPFPGAGSATGTQCHACSQSDPNLCEGHGEQGLCLCQDLWRAGGPMGQSPGEQAGRGGCAWESAELGKGCQQGGTASPGVTGIRKPVSSRCDSWCPRFPKSSHVLPGTSPNSSSGHERVASRS